jgi:hypothetical protein
LSSAGISFGSWRRLARLEQLAQRGGSLSSWYGNEAPEATCGERASAVPDEQASLEGRERSFSRPGNWVAIGCKSRHGVLIEKMDIHGIGIDKGAESDFYPAQRWPFRSPLTTLH